MRDIKEGVEPSYIPLLGSETGNDRAKNLCQARVYHPLAPCLCLIRGSENLLVRPRKVMICTTILGTCTVPTQWRYIDDGAR
jgi:hypothetical protein